MVEAISPINIDQRLAQLLGDDPLLAQAPSTPAAPSFSNPAPAAGSVQLTGNLFEDMLSKTIEALDGVSKSEVYTNQLIDKYMKGEADLQSVMVAQSKLNVTTQLAVTVVNSTVTTFKEITQMQI